MHISALMVLLSCTVNTAGIVITPATGTRKRKSTPSGDVGSFIIRRHAQSRQNKDGD